MSKLLPPLKIILNKIKQNKICIGPPEWRTGSSPGSVAAVWGRRTIGPASSGLGEGLAGRDVLALKQLLWWAGHADTVARCTVFPLKHWYGWFLGKVGSVAWLGCVSECAWLSTFTSLESERELQRWDKTLTTNWIPWNWCKSFYIF